MGTVIIVPGFYPDSTIGTVTLKTEKDLQFLSIVGPSSLTGTSAQYKVSYYPLSTTQRSVSWSVESGGTYATIDSSTGILSVLSSANNSTVVIKVTSTANSDIYATKTLTVTYDESGESTYDANLIASVTGTYADNQTVSFDAMASDNWMICFYRTSGNYQNAAVSDFFTTNGGFGLSTVFQSNNKGIVFQSNSSSSSSTKSDVVHETLTLPICFAIKKSNGAYYYTRNGSTWTQFQSYYYSGESSSSITVSAGRTDRFTNSVYGFYLYDGIDDTLVSDFFTEHS